jgi:heme/copper-type cytochrome/quinol oxidase subunit 2
MKNKNLLNVLNASFIFLVLQICSEKSKVTALNSTQTSSQDSYGTINLETGVNTNVIILIVFIVVIISIVIIVIIALCFKFWKKNERYITYTVETPKDEMSNLHDIEVAAISSTVI